MVDKFNPIIAVCDINKDTIDVLPNVPHDINPATATWTPDGSGVVAVGYKVTPRKLGIIYCTNRSSNIFLLTLNGQYSKLIGSSNTFI